MKGNYAERLENLMKTLPMEDFCHLILALDTILCAGERGDHDAVRAILLLNPAPEEVQGETA